MAKSAITIFAKQRCGNGPTMLSRRRQRLAKIHRSSNMRVMHQLEICSKAIKITYDDEAKNLGSWLRASE